LVRRCHVCTERGNPQTSAPLSARVLDRSGALFLRIIPCVVTDDFVGHNKMTENIKKYAPVQQCIYCGATGVELTDEHIIPFALGGDVVLPKSSCKNCAKITGEIERQCLRKILGPLRIKLDYPTRRPKRRPEKLPINIQKESGISSHEVPAKKRPHVTCLFAFNYPGILRDVDPEILELEPVPAMWFNTVKSDQARAVAHSIDPSYKHIESEGWFNPVLFGKMLGKIGHAFAVAELGLGLQGFRALIPDALIGKAPWHNGYLVGGEPDQIVDSKKRLEVRFGRKKLFSGREFGVVRIRLFGHLGAPVYYVVVGEVIKKPGRSLLGRIFRGFK